ncbi:MAG: SAM-dependent chlorinase/fluorinase [Flavobacteriales bacterium]|jgi:S-adenosylmethionine hydrolase|nr:SAM-dependent chlorinase/fluorinase [Flavobacteriales bacterium]
MAIITLISDMGTKDHYVAAVHGAIISQCPEARIVDISHAITPFSNAQAAFVLRNAYPEFPRGTIHIIGVNPDTDGKTPHLVVRHDGHYFVGADNGIFSLLFDGRPHEAFELTMKLDDDHATFPTKSVLVKAACHIARGGTPDVIGRKTVQIREQIGFRPAVDANSIRGKVLYVDSYGNLMTNIPEQLFGEVGKGRPFRITFGRTDDDITRIGKGYADAAPGDPVAFFSVNGHLEVAINKGATGVGGGAAQLFGVREEDPVRVDFGPRHGTR